MNPATIRLIKSSVRKGSKHISQSRENRKNKQKDMRVQNET